MGAMIKKIKNNKKGFTLIELLVVTTIIVIVSGVIADSFFSSLKGGNKTTITNFAKENGDQAITTIENTVKSASQINPPCLSGTGFSAIQSITITNPDKSTTTYTCPVAPTPQLAIQLVPITPTPTVVQYLTSNNVSIINCSFSCSKQKDSPAVLKISFTVIQSAPNATYRPEEQVSIPYETSVVMRNISEN